MKKYQKSIAAVALTAVMTMNQVVIPTFVAQENNTNNIAKNITEPKKTDISRENTKVHTVIDAPQADTVATVTVDRITQQYSTIDDALKDANGKTATITLLNDVSITNSINITSGDITLYCESYALTTYNSYISLTGGKITIKNGDIASIQYPIQVHGGHFVLDGGSVHHITLNDGTVTINDGYVYAVSVDGGTLYRNGGVIGKLSLGGGVIVRPSPKPQITLGSVTSESITVSPLKEATTYGGAIYKLTDINNNVSYDWQDSNELNNLNPATTYKVYAKYAGTMEIQPIQPTRPLLAWI